ncbi:hypothetical protein HNQ80_003614 [Anaerosolibacter carboniphilus]|uniref:Phage protein n=1 Tax=Anaerosolibacter carboniphilus TaxID=1417629 RepID=A0A841KVT6_9FIRM|nr:hypothetical protein [Anaerosolibacter carboniphilus]MBB6217493.1 hypothetical protein [Anaerosolibacter carboniphilus]
MIKLVEIQNEIYSKLNTEFPTYHIYVGEIPQEITRPAFFMQILPLSTITENQYHRTRKIHIRIRYYSPNGTYLESLEMADQLNEVIGAVLVAGDRRLIIHKIRTSMIDNVLNFAFNLEFEDSIDETKTYNYQNYDYMQELLIKED